MGNRIRAARWFVQELRHAEPKHSFDHAAANLLLGIAGMVAIILGEHRLWGALFAVMMLSIGVQGFRAWRFIYLRERAGAD